MRLTIGGFVLLPMVGLRVAHAMPPAVDIWAAGTILLFFLTGKFPLFHCPNDAEALVEISVIIGKKAMEKAAVLHSASMATSTGLRTLAHVRLPQIGSWSQTSQPSSRMGEIGVNSLRP